MIITSHLVEYEPLNGGVVILNEELSASAVEYSSSGLRRSKCAIPMSGSWWIDWNQCECNGECEQKQNREEGVGEEGVVVVVQNDETLEDWRPKSVASTSSCGPRARRNETVALAHNRSGQNEGEREREQFVLLITAVVVRRDKDDDDDEAILANVDAGVVAAADLFRQTAVAHTTNKCVKPFVKTSAIGGEERGERLVLCAANFSDRTSKTAMDQSVCVIVVAVTI